LNFIYFGLNFGVGYNITENFNMGLRYNLGLTQIQKDLVAGESASKNSVFQIALGYKFSNIEFQYLKPRFLRGFFMS